MHCQCHEMRVKRLQAQQLSRQRHRILAGRRPLCIQFGRCPCPPAFPNTGDRCSGHPPANHHEQIMSYRCPHLHPEFVGTSAALQEVVGAPSDGVQRVAQLPCLPQRVPELHCVPCEHCDAERHRQAKLHIVAGIIVSPGQVNLHIVTTSPSHEHL